MRVSQSSKRNNKKNKKYSGTREDEAKYWDFQVGQDALKNGNSWVTNYILVKQFFFDFFTPQLIQQ